MILTAPFKVFLRWVAPPPPAISHHSELPEGQNTDQAVASVLTPRAEHKPETDLKSI
ncbi:hypothetical protein L195_g061098 [Trifolium pratense]|uniref:Uncharacterized protein n=1 Tax=Trifolium pratense TaxID=57577 RepID=A0A2K3K7S9_TRIPR|nr:hypothetical protein L195_g061098 [Trifolium pratense]